MATNYTKSLISTDSTPPTSSQVFHAITTTNSTPPIATTTDSLTITPIFKYFFYNFTATLTTLD